MSVYPNQSGRARRNQPGQSGLFLNKACEALADAGRNWLPLEQFMHRTESDTYDAFDLATSFPFLKAGFDGLELTERNQDLEVCGYSRADAFHLMGATKEHAIREIRKKVRSGTFKAGRPETVEQDKLDYGDAIDPRSLVQLWKPRCQEAVTGKRPLIITDVRLRGIASSLHRLLSSYLKHRLCDHVVGCREGVGSPLIFATLAQAVAGTGRHHVLAADIKSFFPNVPAGLSLSLLWTQCGINPSSPLGRLIRMVLANREDGGLPQGNPLSPLLANLYASFAIDKDARRFGPFMRYVDDVFILVKSRDHAVQAFQEVQKAAQARHLQLHPSKTRYHDLDNGRSFSLASPDALEIRNLVYLGVELRRSPDGAITFHLTNKAVRRLLESMRKAAHMRPAYLERRRDTFLFRLERLRQCLQGWVRFYGFAEWTGEQELAVRMILSMASISDGSFPQYLTEVAKGLHHEEHDRQELYDDVAARCGMPVHKDAHYSPEEIRVFRGGLEGLRRQSSLTADKAAREQHDLAYACPTGAGWKHTVRCRNKRRKGSRANQPSFSLSASSRTAKASSALAVDKSSSMFEPLF